MSNRGRGGMRIQNHQNRSNNGAATNSGSGNGSKMMNRRMNSQLRADCRTMCPDDEVSLRTKNNLVHALEKRLVK